MIYTKLNFEEATAFELYVLEKFCPVIDKSSTTSIDLRVRPGNNPTRVSSYSFISLSDTYLVELRKDIAPLLFGAAWKIMDLALEFSLNFNGQRPTGKTWRIDEKQEIAKSKQGDPSILGCSHDTWSALLGVYANTVEHRHCLTHRTAEVDATSGNLHGRYKDGGPLTPLTLEEQLALARVAILVARGIARGKIASRSEEHIKHYLDKLRTHSLAPLFGSGSVSAPIIIQLALSQENGQFALDMTGVIDRARARFQHTTHFDLVIDIPDGSGRRLFAEAENCPTGKQPVDLNALPSWLEYR